MPDYIPASAWMTQAVSGIHKKRAKPAVKKEEEEVPGTPLDAREGFTFGCDPEGFIFYNDKPVTAEGLIPGTKENPVPLVVKGETIGYSQVDGMAAEFNIPPVKTFKDFNRCIEGTIKAIEDMLPKGHELRFVPSVVFDAETFNKAPDKAKELGCSPDYNAWDRRINPPPHDPENPYLRTGSGHLHLGWTSGATLDDTQHIANCCDLVQQLDWYLGGWSVRLDKDDTRRKLYGKAGACRFKDYGVEYRVLSNFWVTTRDRRLNVWNRMMTAVEQMSSYFVPDMVRAEMNERLRASINSSKLDPMLSRNHPYPLMSLEQAGFARTRPVGVPY